MAAKTNGSRSNQASPNASNKKNLKLGILVLSLLLLITLLSFGGYVYYKEVYQTEQEVASDTIPELTRSVTRYDGRYNESVFRFQTWIGDEGEDFLITHPSSAFPDFRYLIAGRPGFELEIRAKFESHGVTTYLPNYKKLNNPNYGDFYRVQPEYLVEEYGNYAYFYIEAEHFKASGICDGGPDDDVEAPCGGYALGLKNPGESNYTAIFDILCKAENEEGVEECDKIVASIKKV